MKHVATLLAAAAALPRKENLADCIEDITRAEARGYFLPNEDERIRVLYARYLAVRTSLLECLSDVLSGQWSPRQPTDLREFAVAYAAACLLVRAASYLIDLTENAPVTRQKLDEPESRYQLSAKSFTQIYQSLTTPRRWWGFFDASSFYQARRADILALRADPELSLVVDLLQAEEGLVEICRQDLLQKRLSYRIHSFLRRRASGYRKVMFELFKLSGSSIAELKQPFVKPAGAGKRVDAEVRARLERFLQPGDVLVTRHDDALSNLFLPGFWPHAAFYLGTGAQRAALGGELPSLAPELRFLESKRDGVRLRPADDTLQVDCLVVLRPTLSGAHVATAIERGLSHAGKLYDFIFDFTASDRLACTELVYRAYHGVGPVQFELQSYAGRNCLSAESLINQAVGQGWFEPVLVFGLHGDAWTQGPAARQILRDSFAATF
ncbi:YiiX/YebB-like N1pC/P60 family cysteine hydrolase [Coraliomargarita sp. SDUM461003]|uniref:YiiX/YebB-like N1pC/P60 family cysteine hydrolase n=1 Tax=Thalassobacterium maritimum TaxID=3041265 RepID=A0ABU1ASD0_9BACT|nr:YiiX/YebB-like N1pC/P60 family cysteine hydrolase [Coraliomargarita sp. SDUM461003]MDQ8207064.1 YiiX/YebB-like N1pC/P60 family cysteine hydrolase [Coraliomargarita sp. SDUM461003]